jgi:glycosyltransferase 2 family protein
VTRPGVRLPGRAEARPPGRGRLLWAIRIGLSVSLVGWIIHRSSLAEVLEALRSADLRLVAAAFALNVVGWAISVSRWRVLLGAIALRVAHFRLLQSYLSGIFFNNLLPSTVGGDALRMYDSWRWGAGRAEAVTVIVVDRLMGILALLFFALAALLLAPHIVDELPMLPVWLGLGALAIMGAAAVALLPLRGFRSLAASWALRLPGFVRRPVTKFSTALQAYRDGRQAVGVALGLSVLLQLNVILHFYLIARALALPVGFLALFLIIPLSLAVMAIPLSVNAIGIRENIFALFLSFYGVGISEALAFAWVSFGLILLQGVIGGIVYGLRRDGGVSRTLPPVEVAAGMGPGSAHRGAGAPAPRGP